MVGTKRVWLARGVKPQSINSYLRHIRAALSKAYEWELIRKKPKIQMFPVDKPLPRVLKPDEIEILLSRAKETNTELWRLLVFYLWTGCRRKEALDLTWQDCYLDVPEPYAILRKTKGKKDRRIPLLPPVLESIKLFKKDIGPVFIKIHPDTASHWFQGLATECGIKARLHDIRHTAGSYMIASGINPRVVQEILGHAQFSTTEIYIHMVKDHLRQEMEKLRFD